MTLITKGPNSSTQTGRTASFRGQADYKPVGNGRPTTLSVRKTAPTRKNLQLKAVTLTRN